jgi:hypothetical protein
MNFDFEAMRTLIRAANYITGDQRCQEKAGGRAGDPIFSVLTEKLKARVVF